MFPIKSLFSYRPLQQAPSRIPPLVFLNRTLHTKTQSTADKLFLSEPELTLPSLQKLLKGNILALSVPDFTPATICDNIAKKLLRKNYEYYKYAPDAVGRYGISFSEVGLDPAIAKRYYDTSAQAIKALRSQFAPHLSPIDKLRLELDEVWPKGALLEAFEPDLKTFVGLCRVIDANKRVLPHQDIIAWDAKGKAAERASTICNQLAVNIYLQVPKQGGELELWDYGYTDFSNYNRESKGSYGIQRDKLPPPALTLKPQVGELILFCPQKLHCIREGSAQRLTMSCFVGYRGDKKPLTFWS